MEIKITLDSSGLDRALTLLAEAIGWSTVAKVRPEAAAKHAAPAEPTLIAPAAPAILTADESPTNNFELGQKPVTGAVKINRDEIKKRIAGIVKDKPDGTEKLKAILADLGASKISGVADEQLPDLLARMEAI